MSVQNIINQQEISTDDLAKVLEERLIQALRDLAVRDCVILDQQRALVGAHQGIREAQEAIALLEEELAQYRDDVPEEGTVPNDPEEVSQHEGQ